MRLFTRTTGIGDAATSNSLEVPNTTIAWGGIILVLVQTVSTALGNYLVGLPKQKQDKATIELKENNFQVQLLQRILENQDPAVRASSIKLLLAAGLLKDPEKQLVGLSNNPANLPKWDKHPLETLAGSFEPAPTTTRTAAPSPAPADSAKDKPGH